MRKIAILLFAVVIISCKDVKPTATLSKYYDLDSLIVNQQKALLGMQATVVKQARIAQDSSASEFVPDSLSWSNELDVFKKASLNSPTLLGLYESTIRQDDKSNLQIKEYSPIPGEELEVSYLRIYYLNDISNIRKLEAEYNEDNPLYQSGRKLKMEFEDIKGEAMLSKYSVEGSQKMILQDLMTFNIEGTIQY